MAFLSRYPLFDLLLTALAPTIWDTTYIVTTQFLPPDRPFIAALLRVLPAGCALLLWCRHFPLRNEWWKLIVTGILNIGAFQTLLFVAAYRLPGGLAAVIGAIQPLLVMLLLSPQTIVDTIGIGAAFLGVVTMALGTWLSRRWSLSMPVMAPTGWQLLLGGMFLLPVALLVDPQLPVLTATQIAGYVWLCVAGAMLAYYSAANHLIPKSKIFDTIKKHTKVSYLILIFCTMPKIKC